MDRFTAIEALLRHVPRDAVVLTTTGMISREAFAAKDRPGNFYVIGSMGLASSLGLGLALLADRRPVVVVDGDGSALMSLGTVPLIAYEGSPNLYYVILDNGAYETTGAQPCISERVDLGALVEAAGFRRVDSIESSDDLVQVLQGLFQKPGPACLHVRVDVSRVPGVPRVSLPPETLRDRLRKELTPA